MGLFGKERHGRMETVTKGLQYIWKIPDFPSYRGKILDSENVPSFEDVNFHFHMVVGPDGDIGVYLHYKGTPIPKYSYYFTSASGARMRQHTAHTIPGDTERCGHWNVCSVEEVEEELLSGPDKTLWVFFAFDDDTITSAASGADMKIDWNVPRFLNRNLDPLCSKSFIVDGMVYIARAEHKEIKNEMHFFIFNRKGAQIPPHTIAIIACDGTLIGAIEKDQNEHGGAQILKINYDTVKDACANKNSHIVVSILLTNGANPLDFLNSPPPKGSEANGSQPHASTGGPPPMMQMGIPEGQKMVVPKTVDIGGGGHYAVINSDDV